MKQVKNKHKKFYYFAKGLVETVHLYGVNNMWGKEPGPFYCGLSMILNIGQFDIYLKAPLSTSKDVEIAINFATKQGIVLTLNNDFSMARHNHMIDCSWISRYAEENERLWIGYQQMSPLRICSIRMVSNNKKYSSFFHTLWLFDCIITGSPNINKNIKIKKKEVLLLEVLVSSIINKESEIKNIDSYCLNCFMLYCLNKKNIILRMADIHYYIYKLNECNLSFLFYHLQRKRKGYIGNSKRLNLLQPNLLKLFPNIKHVKMNTKSFNGCYKFNMISFLDVICSNSRDIVYQIDIGYDSYKSWISSSIRSRYNDKQWNIKRSFPNIVISCFE